MDAGPQFSTPACRYAEIRTVLATQGHVYLKGVEPLALVDLLELLGPILHVEDVLVEERSHALLKTTSGLSPHTDHFRAERILWHCIAQASSGGETILVDARLVYASLCGKHRRELLEIRLTEHGVFRGDPGERPLVQLHDGVPDFYYSFWLAREDDMPPQQREAFEAFRAAVETTPSIRLRLQPGDVLVIDNHWILHGRTPIGGDRARHLRRYWLGSADAALL